MAARWDDRGVRPDWLDREDLNRNVIATKEGWVLRRNYTNAFDQEVKREEVLVAAGDLSNTVGVPSVTSLFVANSSGGTTLKNNMKHTIGVLYDEGLVGVPTSWTLTVANTASGNSATATANLTVQYANNGVMFHWTPNRTGTYKVQAQTISGNAALLRSEERVESANLVISASVSNTLGTFSVV